MDDAHSASERTSISSLPRGTIQVTEEGAGHIVPIPLRVEHHIRMLEKLT